VRAVLALALALAPPAAASADELRAMPTERRPTEILIELENDNLFFGSWSTIAGAHLDGTDLGRTHASRMSVARRIDVHAAATLDLSSALFTASLDGSLPQSRTTMPIHFHELDRLRGGVMLGREGAPWDLRFGIALELSNHEMTTPGASGQQQLWHDVLEGTGLWQYELRPDGMGTRFGAAFDASAGGRAAWQAASWLLLEARGLAGARVASLAGGSWLDVAGRLSVSVGDGTGPRFGIAAQQWAHAWVETGGVMLASSLDARLDLGALAVVMALTRYDGDQNARYFSYATPNTTMTGSLVLRP
jgi:hypothetical protein